MANNIKTIGQTRIDANLNQARNKLDTYSDRIKKTNSMLSGGSVVGSIGNTITGIGSILPSIGLSQGIKALAGTALEGLSLGSGLGLIGLAAGGILSIGSSIFNGIEGKKLASQQEQYNNWETYQSLLTSYRDNLEARDSIIQNTRNNVLSSYGNLANEYGSGFANTLRDLYYLKNGIADNVTNFLTGNYSTFGDIGSGSIAGWNDSRNRTSLTDDELNYFNENLQDIQLNDITSSIANKLTIELMNGGTSISEQFKNFENEINQYFTNSLRNQRNAALDISFQLGLNNVKRVSDDISYEQNLGKAESNRASSGLRGGTTNNNELIARMDKAIADFHYQMATAASITSLKNNIENIQLQTAAQVNSVRTQETISALRARENAVNMFNSSIAQTERNAGISANAYLNDVREIEDSMQRVEAMLD